MISLIVWNQPILLKPDDLGQFVSFITIKNCDMEPWCDINKRNRPGLNRTAAHTGVDLNFFIPAIGVCEPTSLVVT